MELELDGTGWKAVQLGFGSTDLEQVEVLLPTGLLLILGSQPRRQRLTPDHLTSFRRTPCSPASQPEACCLQGDQWEVRKSRGLQIYFFFIPLFNFYKTHCLIFLGLVLLTRRRQLMTNECTKFLHQIFLEARCYLVLIKQDVVRRISAAVMVHLLLPGPFKVSADPFMQWPRRGLCPPLVRSSCSKGRSLQSLPVWVPLGARGHLSDPAPNVPDILSHLSLPA